MADAPRASRPMHDEPLRFYGANGGRRYDELLDDSGEVRPHWRQLFERLVNEGPQAAERGTELARRLIVENGVTYNVYADPKGKDHPWLLDPLPFLLRADEWLEIEAGVRQRAELLDRLLADLYGPQRLLAGGLIPPEIPFGHPNFLWPCRGVVPLGGHWLNLYAADLARGPDGRWWILGDRAQTPSGAGYALENREIVTRLFPDLLRDLSVAPLEDFFAAVREQLLEAAPPGESPLAVVLTPGPFNETYFEHVYLAGQLGLPLVEGSDLTVRGDTLYLKTVRGLRRVHAVMRRLDDDYCDPLELRTDSALGVPALLRVVRAGRLLVANALGSGVLESPGWLGFLPGVARLLLGEELRLPSVATWWCGEAPALAYVSQNLPQLVVKATYPNQRFEPVFGRDIDQQDHGRLRERLRRRPHAYVAQERISLSQAPVWRSEGALSFRARSVGMRVYALATARGYRVMPGGLARIATGDLADVLSAQRGGGSKDVWVLSHGSEKRSAVQRTGRAATNEDLPSRLVDNLYWLGRYMERCEDKVRLLRATQAVRSRPEIWPLALEACRLFEACLPTPGVVEAFDDARGECLGADLRRLRRCADQARSRLSSETWRVIRRLSAPLDRPPSANGDLRETLDRALLLLSALVGLAHDAMSQDDGWRFTIIGRRLERLHFLCALLSHRLSAAALPSREELDWLLDLADSTVAYRASFRSTPRLSPVLDLIVHDTRNPRAVAHQWLMIRQLLAELIVSAESDDTADLDAAMSDLRRARRADGIADAEVTAAQRRDLSLALERTAAAAAQLSNRLSARYFSHTDSELHAVVT